jgi:hypothetical protein
MKLSIKDAMKIYVLNMPETKLLSVFEDCSTFSIHIKFSLRGLLYRTFNKGDEVLLVALDGPDKGQKVATTTLTEIYELIESSRVAS